MVVLYDGVFDNDGMLFVMFEWVRVPDGTHVIRSMDSLIPSASTSPFAQWLICSWLIFWWITVWMLLRSTCREIDGEMNDAIYGGTIYASWGFVYHEWWDQLRMMRCDTHRDHMAHNNKQVMTMIAQSAYYDHTIGMNRKVSMAWRDTYTWDGMDNAIYMLWSIRSQCADHVIGMDYNIILTIHGGRHHAIVILWSMPTVRLWCVNWYDRDRFPSWYHGSYVTQWIMWSIIHGLYDPCVVLVWITLPPSWQMGYRTVTNRWHHPYPVEMDWQSQHCDLRILCDAKITRLYYSDCTLMIPPKPWYI